MDKWKTKNTYKIMDWIDDPNFDYSDKRCAGDAAVAVQLLPFLADRGFLVELSYTGVNWVCALGRGEDINRQVGQGPSVQEAIAAAIIKLIEHIPSATPILWDC